MTDITASAAAPQEVRRFDVDSDEARARVKRRYRAEARLKAYGLTALAITAIYLVVLIADILRNGLPAFWQHSLVIDVPVKAEQISETGKIDAAAIKGADYFPITRDALRAAIPGIQGRGPERQLQQLLSSGAADGLRQQLLADPSLIGKTVKAQLLLSDDADLYFKGSGTPILSRGGRGTLSLIGTTGDVRLLSSANDFQEEVVNMKRALAQRAMVLGTEASRLERANEAGLAARIKELRDEAAAIQARVDGTGIEEVLDDKLPSLLVAVNGGLIKITKMGASAVNGEVLLPLKSGEEAKPGSWQVVTYTTAESNRKVSDREVAFLERLKADGKVSGSFNWAFFSSGDSREPELAGIRGAVIGSALTLLVTLGLCLPIGVLAAVYLEEFAPRNKLTYLIEVNINNLAAVPSIVFGLLGLAMFLNVFGLPRSAPLVGGLVLALLVLPTIIIATRAALKAVPPSIKEAALGVGASHQQAVFHHVLPLAMPGIMTGTIIGMAHALGETAPLLMIGMVAFIVDVPGGFTEAATVLPVQIFLWSDLPEVAFKAKTAAAIIVLLGFLFVMNGLAIWLRRKFERRW
jgi:phosphate transport system permease protein